MHILIIPSEEFIPNYNKLDGIFQYHQGVILKEAGYKVGVLSMKLTFSIPMLLKGVFLKGIGKRTGNATDKHTAFFLLKTGFTKLFKPQAYITSEVIDGLIVYRIDGLFLRPPVNNKNHLSWVRAGMICFSRYMKEQGRPDIIHTHNAIYAGMLAQKIRKKYGLRYIVTEHSSTYALKLADSEILKRVKAAYQQSSGLYAVSESFASLLNNLFSFDRFQYLPNVLDQYLETRTYHPSIQQNNKFIFLHIAGLLPVKDQETLLKGFHIVSQQNSAVELWIGGGGELHDPLNKLVKKLSLQSFVKFLGVLNREEVINRLQESNCFILSSKYETFGVVIIEAMLFGKPVIVTRCGVGQNIVTENVGYVVDVGDEKQLASAMLKMVHNYKNYDPEKIRDFTIKNFGKQKFLQNMNTIYKELI